MLERKWTGSGLTLGPQLSPGAQSIVRHNAVKQGRKERVCYNYSIYHIMFNELILKGTVHPNITKHWKIWNTPHEFYGLFLWWFYVVLLSFFGLDSLLPLLLNATYVDYYDVLWVFGLSFWRHPFTADNLLVSKWCNAKFLQICSNEVGIILNLGWLEDEYIFSNSSFLGELCPCLLLYQYLLWEPVRRASRFCKWLDGSAHRHPNTWTKHMTVMVHVKLIARLALLILNQWFSRVSFIMNWNIF